MVRAKKVEKPVRTRPEMTRAQAIHEHCFECMGYQKHEIRKCTSQSCCLWPYRNGLGTETTTIPLLEGHYEKG